MRRLLSHLLISLAVLCFIATYFMWVIDATVLNAKKLTGELRKNGVPSALANVLVDRAVEEMPEQDKEANRPKVAQVLTAKYVDRKLTEIADTLSTYMKKGNPQPSINLTDFPGQIRAAGISLTEEQAARFDEPIQLNKGGDLNAIPQLYKTFSIAKYAGLILCIVLIVAEWFVSPVGIKLRRTGRVFLHTSLWFFVTWLGLIFFPSRVVTDGKIVGSNTSLHMLAESVVTTIRHLFSLQLLTFAIVMGVCAVIFYVLRHTRTHLEKIKDVPTARIRSRTQVKLPR